MGLTRAVMNMFGEDGTHVASVLSNESAEANHMFSNLVNGGIGTGVRDFTGLNSVAREKTQTLAKLESTYANHRAQLNDLIGQSRIMEQVYDQGTMGHARQIAETKRLQAQKYTSYGQQGLAYARRGAGWMFEGNMRQKAKKLGAVGTFLGIDEAHRYATGGDWDHRSDGSRDIAGVPLI